MRRTYSEQCRQMGKSDKTGFFTVNKHVYKQANTNTSIYITDTIQQLLNVHAQSLHGQISVGN